MSPQKESWLEAPQEAHAGASWTREQAGDQLGRQAGLSCTASGRRCTLLPEPAGHGGRLGGPHSPPGETGLCGGRLDPHSRAAWASGRATEQRSCSRALGASHPVGTALRPGFLINELLETPGKLRSLRVAGTLGKGTGLLFGCRRDCHREAIVIFPKSTDCSPFWRGGPRPHAPGRPGVAGAPSVPHGCPFTLLPVNGRCPIRTPSRTHQGHSSS